MTKVSIKKFINLNIYTGTSNNHSNNNCDILILDVTHLKTKTALNLFSWKLIVDFLCFCSDVPCFDKVPLMKGRPNLSVKFCTPKLGVTQSSLYLSMLILR